jgi:hypothetical protein
MLSFDDQTSDLSLLTAEWPRLLVIVPEHLTTTPDPRSGQG